MKFTVYHDGQYWVGVFEEISDNRMKLKACKVTFGCEPADQEILDLINTRMLGMLDETSETVEVDAGIEHRSNPKRLAREAAKELQQKGISTYAQSALQLEREKQKQTRKIATRDERELLRQRKREIAVIKAKEKHRGR